MNWYLNWDFRDKKEFVIWIKEKGSFGDRYNYLGRKKFDFLEELRVM